MKELSAILCVSVDVPSAEIEGYKISAFATPSTTVIPPDPDPGEQCTGQLNSPDVSRSTSCQSEIASNLARDLALDGPKYYRSSVVIN